MTDLTATASILIRKPRADVFDAVVDAEAMSRYWFTRRDSGLRSGQPCTWYLGSAPDAPSFEVAVRELERPGLLVLEWGPPAHEARTMTWRFEAVEGGTRLSVEERGFAGTEEQIVATALDSTGGFNQVVVALKAWVEHGTAINVVASHA